MSHTLDISDSLSSKGDILLKEDTFDDEMPGAYIARHSKSPALSRSRTSLPESIYARDVETVSLLDRTGTSQSLYGGFGERSEPLQHRHTHRKTPGSFRAPRLLSRRPSSIDPSHHPSYSGSRFSPNDSDYTSRPPTFYDERVWYDQFTSIDWIHDSVADALRTRLLRTRRDLRGRCLAYLDHVQGWILVAITGCVTASVAYAITVMETILFDLRFGLCKLNWFLSRKRCCATSLTCSDWSSWTIILHESVTQPRLSEFVGFSACVVLLALAACQLTLYTKTIIPPAVQFSTLDENLAATVAHSVGSAEDSKRTQAQLLHDKHLRPPLVYYSAAGSGVAEIKVIVSGFVLHGYLGFRTIIIKSVGLILSVASGMSLGKEGPYVHIATCIGNICCRLFPAYSHNDGKRREILSAASAAGVAVAFGAPIGGVLFAIEEIAYAFSPKILFRTFFCCIIAALSLKFLDPYGTGKIVLFEVRYHSDFKVFETVGFAMTGILGGALGALFIKAARFWATTFRSLDLIKSHPTLEVSLVAVTTALLSFWLRLTKLSVTELLFELARPCTSYSADVSSLCPTRDNIFSTVKYLGLCFMVKAFLTMITFGIKVPAGIYVPSMVVGALFGRAFGLLIQYVALMHSDSILFKSCSDVSSPEGCVVPGVYAMVAAGATMCGVTRLSITLAVILFELTGSLDYVLPFSLGILAAKLTADAIEPLSIYDLLIEMNAYPFLDNKNRPVFSAKLGDLVNGWAEGARVINISTSPAVPATLLRSKLELLHLRGELDGGLPIVRDSVLVGLVAGPDLQFALDQLEVVEENVLCLMTTQLGAFGLSEELGVDGHKEQRDFTPYVDPAPVALDVQTPMDVVYEYFVRLGLRYICVSRGGRHVGLLHKKQFVKYAKEVEAGLHG